MAKVALLNQKAENVGEIELNDAVFGIEPNNQAIFDMVILQRASLRQGTHKVKGRSEVRGGGRKPYRQKGTGRARQGSTRAPQWVGGGTVFGPTTNRNYKIKLNRKVRRLALKSALSQKIIDNEFTALDTIAFDSIKTKNMVEVLNAFNNPRKVLLVVDEINDNVALSARNLQNVKVLDARRINVYDILDSTDLFMTEAAVRAVEEVLA